ncbi:MAG TPA: hypothetical protein VN426_03820 [Syntrophomonadaceae bacterium]|nr:hypothetical protein [Syntrophomonadaceae bacterium]
MTAKKTFIWILLILIIISLPACRTTTPKAIPPANEQKNTPPAPVATVSAGDYFPSTPGSSWIYKGEGNEFASFTRTAQYTLNGQSQFKEANGGTESTSIYKLSGDSVTRVYFKGESYQAENLLQKGYTSNDNTVLLKTPLDKGSSWETGNDVRTIIDTAARVEAPAGIFDNCIKMEIRSKNSTSVVYEYYRKGTGLVKREFHDGASTISSTLEKYQAGQ